MRCANQGRKALTDNSNLSLDPDIDSYYVMDAALMRAPDIIASTGLMRGTGMSIMRAGVHDIINVINGIAFQTNILALNAAVLAEI